MKLIIATLIVIPCIAACSGDSGPGWAPRPDAAWLASCRADARLHIGRCVDGAGAACSGGEVSADARFASMGDDGLISPVVGPQGSVMFALAARTDGIDPGDAERVYSSDNPTLEIDVLDEDGAEVLATYRGRNGFRPSPDAEGSFEHAQVFIVIDHPLSTVRGRRLTLDAVLTDRDGVTRCGETSIESPASSD